MKRAICLVLALVWLVGSCLAEEVVATPTELEPVLEETEEVVEETEETESEEVPEAVEEEAEEEPEEMPEVIEEEVPEEKVEEEVTEGEVEEEAEEEVEEDQVKVEIEWRVTNGVYSQGGRIWNRETFQYEEDPENPPGWTEMPAIVCVVKNLGNVSVRTNFSAGGDEAVDFSLKNGEVAAGKTREFVFTLGDGFSVDLEKLLDEEGAHCTIGVSVTAIETEDV